MGVIVLGGFLSLFGIFGLYSAATEGVGRIRHQPDTDLVGGVIGLGFAMVFIPLGYLAIRYHPTHLTLTPTAERIGLGVMGLVFLAAAVVLWILAPRIGEQPGDFASDVFSEGPATAVGHAVGRMFGPRASSVPLALAGAVMTLGFIWPAVPKRLYAAWLIVVDAIEMFGYSLLILLFLGAAIVGVARRDKEAIGFSTFFLVLWGLAIGLGLAFGWLDGWVAIAAWLWGLL